MLVPVLAATLLAGAANASEVHLRWDNCAGEGGVQNREFACDTNVGTSVLVISAVLDADLAEVTGIELGIELAAYRQGDVRAFPAWWRFKGADACRSTSLGIGPQDTPGCPDAFPSDVQPNSFIVDQRYWFGDLLYEYSTVRAIRATRSPVYLLAGWEYGVARWTIRHEQTVGSSACGGCEGMVSIGVSSLLISTTGNAGNLQMTLSPWELACWRPQGTCQRYVVPTRHSTWSTVKALYR